MTCSKPQKNSQLIEKHSRYKVQVKQGVLRNEPGIKLNQIEQMKNLVNFFDVSSGNKGKFVQESEE